MDLAADPSKLTPSDFASDTWARLEAHYSARLQKLRIENDRPMDDATRNNQLGRIAEVKAFLDLGKGRASSVMPELAAL